MRYFIASNSGIVVDKQAFSGDDTQINSIVGTFKDNHKNLVVSEVDQTTFDGTILAPTPTATQTLWAALPFQSNPTATTTFQAIHVLAKYLGLE